MTDSNVANFCLPERRQLRFTCSTKGILSEQERALEEEQQQDVSSPVSPIRHSSESKGKRISFQISKKHESKARFGIAVLVANSEKEVTVAKHAYDHPWFCPEVDWPDMLMDAEHQAVAAATAAKCSGTRAQTLQSVCCLPIFALGPSGAPETPRRVLGVLHACNKRNSNGLLNAAGFLETDVSQVRIIARTVGIAIQNAAALNQRFDREFALRQVLDGYRKAASLLHYIMDGPRALQSSSSFEQSPNPYLSGLASSDGVRDPPASESGHEGAKGDKEAETTEEVRATQSLESAIRHMAIAAAEISNATICNISLLVKGAGCQGGANSVFDLVAYGDAGGEATRPDHLKCSVTSRPFPPMPSGGGEGIQQDLVGLGLEADAETVDVWGVEETKDMSEQLASMYRDTAGLSAFMQRPYGPVSLKLQEQILQLYMQQDEVVLVRDQIQYFQTYTFYGKSVASAECLQSTSHVRGIAGLVVRTKKPIRLKFAADHTAFDPFIDSKPGLPTASLLAVPVMDSNGEVRGVVSVANRFASARQKHDGSAQRRVDADGRVGFESFTLADEVAMGVLAEGFVGTLLYHEQRIALSRMHILACDIAEQPTFRAAARAAQDAISSLCHASSAIFFVANMVRGECSAGGTGGVGGFLNEGGFGGWRGTEMKTIIGRGIVGRCALRRQVVFLDEEGTRRDGAGWRREGNQRREEEDEEDEKEDEEMMYEEWEQDMIQRGCAAMAVPVLISRFVKSCACFLLPPRPFLL